MQLIPGSLLDRSQKSAWGRGYKVVVNYRTHKINYQGGKVIKVRDSS